MNIPEDIAFNVVSDWKKRDIHPHDKAMFLKAYMSEKKLTERALGEELGLSHSTVHDWLVVSRISKKQYEDLKASGASHSDIYRVTRSFRKTVASGFSELDVVLSRVIFLTSKEGQVTAVTAERAKRVVDKLSRIIEVASK